jgi:hypothetical protein
VRVERSETAEPGAFTERSHNVLTPMGIADAPGNVVGAGGEPRSDQLEVGALETARDRTEARVELVHALDLLAPVRRNGEPVVNGDAPDHEHLVLEHHLADRLDFVALRIDIDVTRFQRAGEGAGQSAARGRHHVVHGGRVWRVLAGADTVMLRDLRMDAERDRLILGGQVREPLRAAQPLDLHTRYIRKLRRHQRRRYYSPSAGHVGRAPAQHGGETVAYDHASFPVDVRST